MAAKPITLEMKRTTCAICANADQRALRKHWPHCMATNPRNKNGHCSEFATLKPKRTTKATQEAAACSQ